MVQYTYFPGAVSYDFVYLIGLDVHLLQIQTCCSKISCIMDITLHEVINYFFLYIINHSQYQQFLIKFLYLYEICILCHVLITSENDPFLRSKMQFDLSFI
jgi:hypothetical protein